MGNSSPELPDPIPWSNCSSFESNCSEVVEYRCSGWVISHNVLWVLALCCWFAAIHGYVTGLLPENVGFIVFAVGGGAAYAAVLYFVIIMAASWRNDTDSSGCGFCGARVLDDEKFLHEELSKRVHNPCTVFCSTNPGRCFSLFLPFRLMWILFLNLLIGLSSILAVALSVFAIFGLGGGGGGNCNCNGSGCNGDCCSSSSKNKQEEDASSAIGTTAPVV